MNENRKKLEEALERSMLIVDSLGELVDGLNALGKAANDASESQLALHLSLRDLRNLVDGLIEADEEPEPVEPNEDEPEPNEDEPEPIGDPDEEPDPTDGAPGPDSGPSDLPVTQVTRYGITFHFAAPTLVALSVTGDPMVAPDAILVRISPGSQRLSNGRFINGAMLSPTPRLEIMQGFDSEMGNKPGVKQQYNIPYKAKLDVGRKLVEGTPIVLKAGDSVVACVSNQLPGERPALSTAAVLSCVEELPSSFTDFRPSMSPADTRSLPSIKMNLGVLPELKQPSTSEALMLDREMMAFEMEGVFPDYMSQWPGRYIHAKALGPDYGRNIASQHHAAVIACCMPAESQAAIKARRRLACAVVQRGIDAGWNAMEAGEGSNEWMKPDGGHHNGRKLLTVFASLVLGDGGYASTRSNRYSEAESLDYIQPRWVGQYGYKPDMVGLPEWRISPVSKPEKNSAKWEAPYRRDSTANVFWGIAAFLKASPKAFRLWGDKAQVMLDYMERYNREELSRAKPGEVPFTLAYDKRSRWCRSVWLGLQV